jgi:UDP-glucose 4-epimerase
VSNLLVTGGAGFIGSHLCDRLLAEGHRVIALDDLSSGSLENIAEARAYGRRFTFYSLDVRTEGLADLFGRHEPEVVLHLAARGEPALPSAAAAEAKVGVIGLLSVLEASVQCGARKVVFASSAIVYGQSRKLPIKEATLAESKPLTPVAISKKLAEDYLRFYRRTRELDFTSVVLPNVYGPRRSVRGSVVLALAHPMMSGAKPEVAGDGEQTRDFLFVDDAVNALSLALDQGSGQTINIGTGVETSVNQLVRMLGGVTGYRGKPVRAPARPFDIRRSVLANALAERALAWKPWTHLEDGLRETVAALRGG